jgi:hypothetical protein
MDKQKDNPKWTLGAIMNTFGMKRKLWGVDSMPLLEKWMAAVGELTEEEKVRLEKLRKKLLAQADNWNEEELKMYFIAFILEMVGYLEEDKPYHAFFEQSLSTVIESHKLASKPDMLLAKGVEDQLYVPYFCFHEYKKSKPDKDPRAQLIMDMLIAQDINANHKPVYGCYVAGKFWTFVVLDGKEFMMSEEIDASKTADLQRLIFILRHFWVILETELLVD